MMPNGLLKSIARDEILPFESPQTRTGTFVTTGSRFIPLKVNRRITPRLSALLQISLSGTGLIAARVCSIIPAWLQSVRHSDISAQTITTSNCASDLSAHPPNSEICGQLTTQLTVKLQLPTRDFMIGGRPSPSVCGPCFSKTALWEPSGFGRCQIAARGC